MALEVNDVLERVREAKREYDVSLAEDDPAQRHTSLRLAYGALSQAASDAYMIFSANPKLNMFSEGGLSTWARDELGILAKTLGAQYYKQGLVDSDRLEREFDQWLARVRLFIDKLNADTQLDSGQARAKDWKEDQIKRDKKRVEDFNKNMMGKNGVVEW